ncbi:MAG: transposase domain-containing protein [Rudaea sp.]
MGPLATVKTNDHDSHAWLTDLLTRLSTAKDRQIADLLPHSWKTAR